MVAGPLEAGAEDTGIEEAGGAGLLDTLDAGRVTGPVDDVTTGAELDTGAG